MPSDSVGLVSSIGRAFVCETEVSNGDGSNLTSMPYFFSF